MKVSHYKNTFTYFALPLPHYSLQHHLLRAASFHRGNFNSFDYMIKIEQILYQAKKATNVRRVEEEGDVSCLGTDCDDYKMATKIVTAVFLGGRWEGRRLTEYETPLAGLGQSNCLPEVDEHLLVHSIN